MRKKGAERTKRGVAQGVTELPEGKMAIGGAMKSLAIHLQDYTKIKWVDLVLKYNTEVQSLRPRFIQYVLIVK